MTTNLATLAWAQVRAEASFEVNLSTLLALSGELTSQQKSDVSDSLLYAQLAASQVADKLADPDAFWEALLATLSALGWAVSDEEGAIVTYPPPLDWRAIALTSFRSTYGSDPPLMAGAIAAAAQLDPGSAAVRLWPTQHWAGDTGLFLLGLAERRGAGGPQLSLLQTSFKLEAAPAIPGGFEPAAAATLRFTGPRLDEAAYGRIRQQVRDKLGAHRRSDIAPIPT